MSVPVIAHIEQARITQRRMPSMKTGRARLEVNRAKRHLEEVAELPDANLALARRVQRPPLLLHRPEGHQTVNCCR
eukprot:642261-Rhodomonas_salina.4